MRVFFKKRHHGRIEYGIIYGGIALAALAISRLFPVLSLSPPCAFRGLFGIPCPTCGATRAVVHLSHGDVAAALAMNPLVAVIIAYAIVFMLYNLIALAFDVRRIDFAATEREKNAARAATAAILLAQWGYLIRTL